MVLGCEQPITGYHETNFSMAYSSHISWQSATSPVPMEVYPSLAFDSLFDNRGSQRNKSILDRVREEAAGPEPAVSVDDRAKLDEYLTSVREVEKRVVPMRAAKRRRRARRDSGQPTLTMPRPDNGLPEDIREHMRLMCDLIALGFQTDKTRIATLLLCRDISGLFYPFLNVRAAHHGARTTTSPRPTSASPASTSASSPTSPRASTPCPRAKEPCSTTPACCSSTACVPARKHDASKVPVVLAGGLGGTLETGRVLDYARQRRRKPQALLHVPRRSWTGWASSSTASAMHRIG